MQDLEVSTFYRYQSTRVWGQKIGAGSTYGTVQANLSSKKLYPYLQDYFKIPISLGVYLYENACADRTSVEDDQLDLR